MPRNAINETAVMYSLYATPLRKIEEGYVEITPCHTASSTKAWFQRKNIEVFPWPSQSPDLNPIEHVWEEMKTKMENRTCKNVEELERAIFQCWQDID